MDALDEEKRKAILAHVNGALPWVTARQETFIAFNLLSTVDGRWVSDDGERGRLIARARAGDVIAQDALLQHASYFLRSGKPMPRDLELFQADHNEGLVRRGGKPRVSPALLACVPALVEAVLAVVPGIEETRNITRRKPGWPACACSLIADAFAHFNLPTINEEAVMKAWKARPRP